MSLIYSNAQLLVVYALLQTGGVPNPHDPTSKDGNSRCGIFVWLLWAGFLVGSIIFSFWSLVTVFFSYGSLESQYRECMVEMPTGTTSIGAVIGAAVGGGATTLFVLFAVAGTDADERCSSAKFALGAGCLERGCLLVPMVVPRLACGRTTVSARAAICGLQSRPEQCNSSTMQHGIYGGKRMHVGWW